MKNRFFVGLHSIFVICLMVLVFVGFAFGENDYIETEDVNETVTKKVLDLDNVAIQFRPDTGEVDIRSFWKSLDAEGNEVSRKTGKSFNYKNAVDNPDTAIDETHTGFSDFLEKIGLTQAELETKIKQAIREIEAQ